MNAAPESFTVRRVLVAIDSGASGGETFETAVVLAARWKAELLGLVLEDAPLSRLAAASLVRHLSLSAESLPVDPAELDAQIGAAVARAQRRLAEIVAATNPELSFHTIRASALPPLSQAADELLVLSDESRPVSRYAALASPLRAVAERAASSVLLLRRPGLRGRPVLYVCDAVANLERTIGAAARLAELSGSLTVVVRDGATDVEERIRAQVRGVPLNVRRLPAVGVEELASLVAEGCGAVVLSGASPLAGEAVLGTLIERLRCALLIVR